MKIIDTISDVRKIVSEQKKAHKSIGLVPTMGALHEGHLSLLKKSKIQNDYSILSIFVNPLQFGPQEDFEKYPRTLDLDAKSASSLGVDLIYHPFPQDILGNNMLTAVEVKNLGDNLCGAQRPGHFRGVCTIVAKLFNILTPDRAYFGQKDIQQLFIIKRMVKDLNYNIEIIECPIIREHDGLAKSSRNLYLSPQERKEAVILSQMIKKAVQLWNFGERHADTITASLVQNINAIKSARVDYVKIVNKEMQDVSQIDKGDILAMAVYVGQTRLIDNYIFGEKLSF